MAVLQPHHRSHGDNAFSPLGYRPSSFVGLSVITDRALKRDILGLIVLAGVRVQYRDSQVIAMPNLIIWTSIAPGVLGSRSRLQGLRGACPSDTPSFNVHYNHSDLCDPSVCYACWTFTSSAIAFIRGLEDALSTSILFIHNRFSVTYPMCSIA
jgi:hypothetical protein